ncbi:hypothetical protein ABH912_005465 [Pseudomonas sp. BT76 TE3572]|uniref:Uncharacterized protein n=1 Tax=Pseudomonas mandelii PD30 TaxID=1419583 RepID=A0A059KVM7_9PSED|nr:hypothetical protein [Pseudomonas mandelii]KDD66107.1 hypothetical protein V466_25335 [Pseudomonas mandelii PD30]
MKVYFFVSVSLALMGTVIYVLFEWEAAKNRKQHALCEVAQQYMEGLDAQAWSSTTGLSLYAYNEHKEAGLLTPKRIVIVTAGSIRGAGTEAVIPDYVEQFSGSDIDNQLIRAAAGQWIPDEIKQEIKRAIKSLSAACNRY